MAEKKIKTNFGRLLEQYREEYSGPHRSSRHQPRRGEKYGLSQLGLEYLLVENDYYITSGLVNKYESGERNPPPEFIQAVAEVLDLKKEQADALVEARLADDTLKFLTAFRDASRGKTDAKDK